MGRSSSVVSKDVNYIYLRNTAEPCPCRQGLILWFGCSHRENVVLSEPSNLIHPLPFLPKHRGLYQAAKVFRVPGFHILWLSYEIGPDSFLSSASSEIACSNWFVFHFASVRFPYRFNSLQMGCVSSSYLFAPERVRVRGLFRRLIFLCYRSYGEWGE